MTNNPGKTDPVYGLETSLPSRTGRRNVEIGHYEQTLNNCKIDFCDLNIDK